jgi:hypothetical protein
MSGWGDQMEGENRRYVPPHVRGGAGPGAAPPDYGGYGQGGAYGAQPPAAAGGYPPAGGRGGGMGGYGGDGECWEGALRVVGRAQGQRVEAQTSQQQ